VPDSKKARPFVLYQLVTLRATLGGGLGENAIMEEFHQRAAKRARGDLGPCRFETLRHPDAAEPDPGSGLTGRERAIADLVASGMSNREIAEQLVISKRTVDSHAEHIFAKLGITSRVQLAVKLLDAEDAIIR
jgi:non-specific serine/threonine protein kinase